MSQNVLEALFTAALNAVGYNRNSAMEQDVEHISSRQRTMDEDVEDNRTNTIVCHVSSRETPLSRDPSS